MSNEEGVAAGGAAGSAGSGEGASFFLSSGLFMQQVPLCFFFKKQIKKKGEITLESWRDTTDEEKIAEEKIAGESK